MPHDRIKLICCDVFREELRILGVPPNYDVEYLAMGLHYHPNKLHQELDRVLDGARGYSLVILGFGLCGGSLKGIRAPGCPVVIPRVHDCLPVLLGSRKEYDRLQREFKGTFYFSGGWVEGDRMLIQEYRRSCGQFGPQKAHRIFTSMFGNYRRMLYIHTGHPRDESTLEKTREFAGTFSLPCHETTGNPGYLKQLVFGPWDSEHFVTVPAQGVIKQDEFLAEGEELRVQGT